MSFRFRTLCTALCFTILTINPITLGAVDLPHFYRAPLFQGEAQRNTSDWVTHIDFRYTEGSTKQSWNTQEVKTCLFNAHCPFDLRNLAKNIECLDQKPLTKAYTEGPIPQLYDGKLAFDGHFSIKEYDFTLQQNILYGLYIQAYVPIRKLTINCIDHIQAVTTQTEHNQLVEFVQKELDAILAEHSIKPLKTPFCGTELSDPLISLGWHGHCKFSQGIVTALRGYLQAGVTIPTGSKKDVNQIFSIPFGYNKHWGFNARGNIHATLWKKLAVGANAGVTVFAKQTYDQRITTSPDQNGWILLEKGRVSTDLGTMWDVTAYAKAERIIGGLSALVGYSYVQQEDTQLTLKDNCALKTALENETIKNRDEVINANRLLKQWYQHTLHAYLQYDVAVHTDSSFAPKIQVAYHYPILAKHTFNADMWSGSASLAISWDF